MISVLSYFPKDKGQKREFLRVFLRQIYFTYIQSIPLMATLGFFAGPSMALQTNMGLSMLGGKDSLAKIIVVVLIRELAPLMASLVLIARSATAVASELATMKVQQEIDSLVIMGIDIRQYLLGPRIMAAILSSFCMAIVFSLAGILSAWPAANYFAHLPLSRFLNSIAYSLAPIDFVFFVCKTSLIGFGIIWAAINSGLSLKKAPFEVPIVTNKAVIDCLFVALGMQIVLSILFYMWAGVHL